MALQVCTSTHHIQLRLETSQNPRDQSRISLMFAESTLSRGRKKSFCSMLHLRKAFPSSQHSLEPQHTFVCPAVCAAWLPGRLSPEPAASTGTPRAAHGALLGHQGLALSGDGRESPTAGKGRGCWLQGNLCQYGTDRWRAKSRCSVLPQLRAPTESAKMEGTRKGPALSPAQNTPGSPHPVPESFPDAPGALVGWGKPTPL